MPFAPLKASMKLKQKVIDLKSSFKAKFFLPEILSMLHCFLLATFNIEKNKSKQQKGFQLKFLNMAVVVVKWSACLPSTPLIRVQIKKCMST